MAKCLSGWTSRCACGYGSTSWLNDPAPEKCGMKPRRYRGVRCSRLVRRRYAHLISKISGRPRRPRSDGRPCRCAGNVTATDAKHTKRNPRHRRERPLSANSTGGNGGNRGPIPSPSPLPPVQNARAAQFRRTSRITDPAPETSGMKPRRYRRVRCIRLVAHHRIRIVTTSLPFAEVIRSRLC